MATMTMPAQNGDALGSVFNLSANKHSLKDLLAEPVRFRKATSSTDGPDLTKKYTPLNRPPRTAEDKSKPNGVSKEDESEGSDPTTDEDGGDVLEKPQKVLFPANQLPNTWGSNVYQPAPGLQNLGNTCFLNSVMQAMMHVPPLARYLLSGVHSAECRMSDCVFCAMEEHAGKCYPNGGKGRGKVFAPKGIVGKLRHISKLFRVGRQEDAHEFMRCLIDAMQKSALQGHKKLDARSQETTVIHRIFGGYIRQQVRCLKCNHPSNTYQPMLDISLDIGGGARNSIESALAAFVKNEKLSGRNKYKCEKCRTLVDALKGSVIYEAPPVLTLHLKRFTFGGGFQSSKIGRHVQFGETLDIAPYMAPNQAQSISKYNLAGVVVHEGGSTRSGHYIGFGKGSNGVWMEFDDAHSSNVSVSTVLKQKAYILVYTQGSEKSSFKPVTPAKVNGIASTDSPASERGSAQKSKVNPFAMNLAAKAAPKRAHDEELGIPVVRANGFSKEFKKNATKDYDSRIAKKRKRQSDAGPGGYIPSPPKNRKGLGNDIGTKVKRIAMMKARRSL
ncbi:hypothetical protein YB2330_002110 [Saitoella coloradoensis]